MLEPFGEGKACYSLGIYVSDVDQTVELALAKGATLREPVRILFLEIVMAVFWTPSAPDDR